MKRYAMILLEKVIDILESDTIPVYPPDPDGNEVTAVECPEDIQVGDEYKDGEFILIGDRIIPPNLEPTQLDRIEEQQLILMEAQAEQYEQNLENRLNDMEVQATLYEAILALGGEI